MVVLISCKKEEDMTTYQIINNAELELTDIQYLDGSMYEVIVFHFKGDDVIHQDEIIKIEAGGGKSEIIDVSDGCEKLKLSFRFLPEQSDLYDIPANSRKYLVDFTVVEQGKNNILTLTGQTMISDSMNSGMPEGVYRADKFELE